MHAFRRFGAFFIALGLCLGADVGEAKPLPSFDELATPSEAALYEKAMAAASRTPAKTPADALAQLDALLSEVAEPTKFRGVLQMQRARLLEAMERTPDAIAAAEESIRLLPGYTAPLMLAAQVYTYSNRSGVGADYLIRAARLDPSEARSFDELDLNSMIYRLRASKDHKRLQGLAVTMLDIGWTGERLTSRSQLAELAIIQNIAQGDVPGAKALVPELLAPAHSRRLLSNKSYSAVWPTIEQWSGTKLEKQWKLYLPEAKARWSASRSIDALGDYLRALAAANRGDIIVREIVPVFTGKLDPERDHDMLFLFSSLASVLADEGRWQDLNSVRDNFAKTWPLGSGATALNVPLTYGRYSLLFDRPAEALEALDSAIADAGKRGEAVNADALAGMRAGRACALHELGRDPGIQSLHASIDDLAFLPRLWLALCLDQRDAARRELIAGLKQDEDRDDAIEFFQKRNGPVPPSRYGRRIAAVADELRQDPILLAELEKYGRILAFAEGEGAPSRLEDEGPAPTVETADRPPVSLPSRVSRLGARR